MVHAKTQTCKNRAKIWEMAIRGAANFSREGGSWSGHQETRRKRRSEFLTRRREDAKEKTQRISHAKTRRKKVHMEIEEVARVVVDCGYRLHTELGPGLLESVYEVVLAKLLTDCGFCLERQKPIPIIFSGLRFDEGFRADLLVEGKLLVEIKSVENLAPVHGKQLLTYLKLLNLPLGLLMNFGTGIFKNGIKRIVNNHADFASSRLRVHQGLIEDLDK